MLRRHLPPVLILLALPLLLFWQQTLGGHTLLPADNLYQTEPYASYRQQVGAPEIPHNHLLDDLVLENLQWKAFIRESLALGEFPLWNPHQFAGIPFFAAGQPSTLYPFNLLYYVMDLGPAYGWFTVLQLWLAGVCMYLFALAGLRLGRAGALVAGTTYQLSGFFVISAVFPMIIAAAAWLPLLLLMIEFIIRQQPAFKQRPTSVVWALIGALALGCAVLAGHVEITYYTLIISAYYAAARLAWELWRDLREMPERRPARAAALHIIRRGLWLLAMVALGLGLGAVQFVPLFELASQNFRSGRSSFEQVLGWAHPARDVLQFVMPNFYGSPAHHSYFDVFSAQNVSLIDTLVSNSSGQRIVHTEWGMKNYVEGALYLGLLPLALALYALLRPVAKEHPPYRWILTALALLGLTFMFGLPTYALLYYLFPGIDQLHSPFRWIFAVTLCVAALAGMGAHALLDSTHKQRTARWFGFALLGAGALILTALVLSRVFYMQLEPLLTQLFLALAKAPDAFADVRMFYSYQFGNVLVFGLVTLAAGLVFLLASQAWRGTAWAVVGLIAADLLIAAWGFNPAADPAWLNFRPPAVQWLQENSDGWRYTTLDDPTQRRLLNANVGMRYGLDDIRGYESIIPRQYVDYMQMLMPQVLLEFNRIAPLYVDRAEALESPLLDLLNVRYVVAHLTTDLPGWTVVYEDAALRIWENPGAVPRAYIVPGDNFDPEALRVPENYSAATITRDTGREQYIDLHSDTPAWLIVSQSYFSGWRAFIRPQGGTEQQEQPLDVQRVQGNFQGVYLPDAGNWTIRLIYSPTSFQAGAFATGLSLALLLFIGGVYLWRLFLTPQQDSDGSSIARVARNSLAPILLNLFNRGIDFAFAIIMLRILGPAEAGVYAYVVVIFMWFDIFTNFGLNLFLVREVAREKSRAGFYFLNTSALRFLLIVLGIPLLALFFALRQNLPGALPLDPGALLAIALLYIGLLPSSLSTGLTALYYAFEKAEYPAAVQTVTTINKTILGLAALLLGWGFVGLAGVSIVTNALTLAILAYNARAMLRNPQAAPLERPNPALMRGMARESLPLMLNHFLATIFFQIDIVIIQPTWGDRVVGQYSTAYKWLQAINVIPAFFTQALLPLMSRQAHEDRAALRRTYTLAIKLLSTLALPCAVLFTVLAVPLTALLGGAEYLPDGAIALQIMIWSIPIGWMNSLTQYVLIALDLQRSITRAFLLAVAFNLITNLIFIPLYGYRAAAVTTILSELMLLLPFAWLLQKALGRLNWLDMLWRPTLASAALLLALLALWDTLPLLALPLGVLVYGGVLLLLRPLDADEMARLSPLLPARVRALVTR
ncbi:MAG: flippase [Chloroflexi bacterium]|nr:flippase [Chloroflexota bacterium]